jgi:hypothetical protein
LAASSETFVTDPAIVSGCDAVLVVVGEGGQRRHFRRFDEGDRSMVRTGHGAKASRLHIARGQPGNDANLAPSAAAGFAPPLAPATFPGLQSACGCGLDRPTDRIRAFASGADDPASDAMEAVPILCTRCDPALGAGALAALLSATRAISRTPVRFAPIPVFPDNDAAIVTTLRQALAVGTVRTSNASGTAASVS